MSDGFCPPSGLGLPYVGPAKADLWANAPLWAIRVEISVNNPSGGYEPSFYRNAIVRSIGNALPVTPPDNWWYLAASPAQAFLFLHDVSQSKVLVVSEAETYVRIGDAPTTVESDWALAPGNGFERSQEENDELAGSTAMALTSRVLLTERPHPIAAYNEHVRQMRMIQRLKKVRDRWHRSRHQRSYPNGSGSSGP